MEVLFIFLVRDNDGNIIRELNEGFNYCFYEVQKFLEGNSSLDGLYDYFMINVPDNADLFSLKLKEQVLDFYFKVEGGKSFTEEDLCKIITKFMEENDMEFSEHSLIIKK